MCVLDIFEFGKLVTKASKTIVTRPAFQIPQGLHILEGFI
jgi:hypothetical protein